MVVNSTCRLDDRLFIGTDTGLVVIDGSNKLKSVQIDHITSSCEDIKSKANLIKLLEETRIRSIIKDSKDRLWILIRPEWSTNSLMEESWLHVVVVLLL